MAGSIFYKDHIGDDAISLQLVTEEALQIRNIIATLHLLAGTDVRILL